MVYKSPQVILQLYNYLVHHIWSTVQWYGGLIYRKTVRLLDRVQHHMMRMIPGYKHIPYEVIGLQSWVYWHYNRGNCKGV